MRRARQEPPPLGARDLLALSRKVVDVAMQPQMDPSPDLVQQILGAELAAVPVPLRRLVYAGIDASFAGKRGLTPRARREADIRDVWMARGFLLGLLALDEFNGRRAKGDDTP